MKRIVITGYGSIGRRHARLIKAEQPETELVVVRRHCDEPLEIDGAECLERLDDALALKPDAAIVAGPASFHLEQALTCLEAGVPVLIEKPLSVDAQNLESLLQARDRAGVPVMVGYNLRHLPVITALRQAVLEGSVGRVCHVHAEVGQYLPDWRPQQDYRQTVSAQARLGGGVLLELSHELDYLCWIFGAPLWVQAWLGRRGSLEIDVEDTAIITLGFAGSDIVASVRLDFLRRDTTRRCEVVAEKGSLCMDAITGTLKRRSAGDCVDELHNATAERDYTYIRQMQRFFNCVESGYRTSSLEQGIAVMKLIDAIRLSARQGRRVDVDVEWPHG